MKQKKFKIKDGGGRGEGVMVGGKGGEKERRGGERGEGERGGEGRRRERGEGKEEMYAVKLNEKFREYFHYFSFFFLFPFPFNSSSSYSPALSYLFSSFSLSSTSSIPSLLLPVRDTHNFVRIYLYLLHRKMFVYTVWYKIQYK